MNSTIQCATLVDFLDVCAGLVRRGIIFRADATTLFITLTGGY